VIGLVMSKPRLDDRFCMDVNMLLALFIFCGSALVFLLRSKVLQLLNIQVAWRVDPREIDE
jgi:hypothetical protein